VLAFSTTVPQKAALPELRGSSMIDFAVARRMMVDGQVRTADVTDPRITSAMLDLPRERFFPEDKAALAYLDADAPVSDPGRPVRCLLRPMVLARLIQSANVVESDNVLDVGCATGYSTALLGRLAGSVVGLEEDAALARHAAEVLAASGASNTKITSGPLSAGFPDFGPYDVVVLEGGTEIEPTAFVRQLKEGGRLACILGSGLVGRAMIYRRIGNELSGRAVFDATAPLLPGFAKPREFVF
jgi:protein-L-isoaspartate(D-aspartate) O-methyltransferase